MTTPAQKLVKAGAMLGSGLEFFKIETTSTDLTDQVVLNKVVECVALNGQPVLVTLTSATEMTVAVEHVKAWTASAMQTALNTALAASDVTVTAV